MDDSDRRERVKQYYDCYARGDRETLTTLLVKPLSFTSSYAEYDDRDSMLDAIWPHVAQNTNTTANLEIFGMGDRLMVKYDLVGSGVASMCEFIRFSGQKIAAIEVFVGKSTLKRCDA